MKTGLTQQSICLK